MKRGEKEKKRRREREESDKSGFEEEEAESFEPAEWSERLTSRRVGWLGAAAVGSIPPLVTVFSFSSLLLLFLSSLSKPLFLLSIVKKIKSVVDLFQELSLRKKSFLCICLPLFSLYASPNDLISACLPRLSPSFSDACQV